MGIAYGINQIIKNTETDILITLDADIRIISKTFIRELIKPIIIDGAHLTASSIKNMQAYTWVGRALQVGTEIK